MKIVIFGLSVSSAWGNGHATLWRGLGRALSKRGHKIVFFEKDTQFYSEHRDAPQPHGIDLRLYGDWTGVRRASESELEDADVGMVTSYCPDGIAATEMVVSSPAALHVFYDLDAPVTLDRLQLGEPVDYVGPRGYRDFDLVLSYTGGVALKLLQEITGARQVAPLYGSVDPELHRPAFRSEKFRADLSYMGTYARDRQPALKRLFVDPAKAMPDRRFCMAGAQYDSSFPWTENIFFVRHLDPAEHPLFYSSSRLTLNVTRKAMQEMGWCPSARLFEAAACGTPILTDNWPGLEVFFEPGREILLGHTTQDAIDAVNLPNQELRRIAQAARERVLEQHTAMHRAVEFERICESALAQTAAIMKAEV